MNVQNRSKLNKLEQALPEGLLVDASWLERNGYSRALRSQYVSAGWLQCPTRSVFRRPRGKVSWEQVIISLQTLLGYSLSVGGRTALELQGYAHYVPQTQLKIHLYSDDKLPSWLLKLPLDQQLITHNRQRLISNATSIDTPLSLDSPSVEGSVLDGGFRITHWGQWKWPLVMSTPERAYIELLDALPQDETFHMADVIMEGLVNISPRRMQALLEKTKSIKVKRLFFFFADRHQHQWLTRIGRDHIDLGSGKRMLVRGGKLDPVYQITVPQDFIQGDDKRGL
ncbi:MAG: type IV toxin-antitoxin system AbiEi family antitoxin [Hahellaceae bacterium]|jgi:hypothetical protein|nr:type IV toxin-antitoxin system AbiEi family antitoxin [Hahellaceae bacterium]MCP5212492.1 type IV toxin-antitoxin system AbiEi family antitoxin [Hahellaceae bacterium]